ncbi:MAG: orotidine-5'-phosphate decarboxylase [Rhodothermia bacterium]|nr:MAG: orotidine-5'-phosphate decarboxylase [Rhodothermia bacterium]
MDPDPVKIPPGLTSSSSVADAVLEFTERIIHATSSYATAFKFNIAFFEALGIDGFRVLGDALSVVPENVLTIADAKRGDIGNTARFYAKAFFKELNFDAITISPYMGGDSVRPFLEYEGKGVFLLVRTSNPGGNELQTLMVEGDPLYHIVARQAVDWARNLPGTLGFVVGATDLDAMAQLRTEHPNVPFLIPGIGAQGGNATSVMDAAGSGPVLINSSRQILYASSGDDFAQKAAEQSEKLCLELREVRP